MRWILTCLAWFLALVILMPATATAATVVKLDMPNLVASSDAIVVAEVTEIDSELDADGRVYTTIEFSTDDVLKGEPGESFSIRQVGGQHGDIATRAPGMPDFERGEEVFLFLSNFETHPVITGLSQGKFRVAVGPDDETRFVVPQLHGVHLVDPKDAPRQAAPGGDEATDELQVQAPPFDMSSHAEVFRQVHEFGAFRQQVEVTIEAQREESR